MTLNYTREIMTSHPWTFLKLLLNWRASIWKVIYPEVLCWLVLYAILSVIYRCALSDESMESFENVVVYFNSRLTYFPLDLLLGFYIKVNMDRWHWRYRRIGFIDNIGLMTALYVRGHDETGRRYRRAILRYSQLAEILVFRDISLRCRKRFPTLDTICAAGFMRKDEKEMLESMKTHYAKHWIPFNWAHELAYDARKKGYIEGDYYLTIVTKEIQTLRTYMEENVTYDWTPIPLLYSHVVCLTVHFYFIVALLGRQFIISEGSTSKTPVDIYFPLMTTLQFIFYIGWLKVSEVILNPFGEDDDDWETNALTDRNIAMGMAMVDHGFDYAPELRKDPFWNDETINPLYSENSTQDNGDGERGMHGSASAVKLGPKVKQVHMVRKNSQHHNALHLKHHNGVGNGVHAAEAGEKIVTVAVSSSDTEIIPKSRSVISLDRFSLKNTLSSIWVAHHKNRPGESNYIIRPPSPTVDVLDSSVLNGNLQDHGQDNPTFIDIEMDEHLPKPSAPVEVPPPPNHLPVPIELPTEVEYVSDLDPKRISKIVESIRAESPLPSTAPVVIAEHDMYCSDLDPARTSKMFEKIIERKLSSRQDTSDRRSGLPSKYNLPRKPL